MRSEFACSKCGSDTDDQCRICGFPLCESCFVINDEGEVICTVGDPA